MVTTRTEYIKGLRRYFVTVTTPRFGTFIDPVWARTATAALAKARRKWHGAAVVVKATA